MSRASAVVSSHTRQVFCCLDCAWSYTMSATQWYAAQSAAAPPPEEQPAAVESPASPMEVTADVAESASTPRRVDSPIMQESSPDGPKPSSQLSSSHQSADASVDAGAAKVALKASSMRPPRLPKGTRTVMFLDTPMGSGHFLPPKGACSAGQWGVDSSTPSSHAMLELMGFGDPI
jgi:hypothetical protein